VAPLDDEDETPTVENPCPRCGSPLVVIGLPGVPPPALNAEIWETIFAAHCVRATTWQWCREGIGHLTVQLSPPSRNAQNGKPAIEPKM
jgi:hypothetical protein